MQKTFGDLLLAAMDARGWSLGEVPERTGLSSACLQKLRAGRVARPHSPTVAALAKAFRVSAAEVRAAIAASRAAAEDQ